jgi:acyl dehydratase
LIDIFLTTIEEIQQIDLVKYSGASGDFNEIHSVPHIAKEKGFNHPIAHGMYVMGLGSRIILEWFPYCNIQHFNVRFLSVVYPGDVLSFQGKIISDEQEHETKRGELEVRNQLGDLKLNGYFELKSI